MPLAPVLYHRYVLFLCAGVCFSLDFRSLHCLQIQSPYEFKKSYKFVIYSAFSHCYSESNIAFSLLHHVQKQSPVLDINNEIEIFEG